MSDGQYAHIERAHRRLEAALTASTVASPDPHVVDEAFLEATTALGELQAAAEEIAQQNRELSEARALLAEDRARYQAHFAAAPDAYLVTDGAGVVEDANRAAEALLGRPYRHLLGQPLSAFFRGEHQVAYFRGLAAVSEHGTSRWSASLARPAPEPAAGGTEGATPVEIIVSGDGAGASLRWLVRDNTVQVEAEDRRREAVSRERAIAETLRSLDQMKTDFLLVVTHNLRTPIASILHTTDLLRSGELDPSGPQWSRALELLGDSAEHLQRINADLLDLERAASGALPVHPGEVDLVELISEVVAITLEGERAVIVPPGPHLARVDESLLRRIVELLLDNADRYAADGPIEVQVAGHEGLVRLTVADRGPGVPDAEKEAVFELFRRGDGTQTEGTGIGLHLVRRFAERHGGRAWVEDREGGGACFCVELGAIVPIAGDDAAHLPE